MKKTILKRFCFILPIFLSITMVIFAQRTITGIVTDDSEETLIGGSVLVKGTTTGTVTDIDGSYSLDIPAGKQTLVFSYTGYTTQEVETGLSNVLDVTLNERLCCFCHYYISEEEYWFRETQQLLAQKAALKQANIRKRNLRRLQRKEKRNDRKVAREITKELEKIEDIIVSSIHAELGKAERIADSNDFANLQITAVSDLKQKPISNSAQIQVYSTPVATVLDLNQKLISNSPQIQVYPNPIADVLHVKLEIPLQKRGLLEIYDASGQLVKTELLLPQQDLSRINLGGLTKGFYLLRIPYKNSFVYKKIIKQ